MTTNLQRELYAAVRAAPRELATCPVLMAAETVVHISYAGRLSGPAHYLDLAMLTNELLPPNATPFERGVALGMAILLSMEAEARPGPEV